MRKRDLDETGAGPFEDRNRFSHPNEYPGLDTFFNEILSRQAHDEIRNVAVEPVAQGRHALRQGRRIPLVVACNHLERSRTIGYAPAEGSDLVE